MASETKFKETEIGMIPKEWEVKELGKLTTKITTGSTPPSDVREYVENGVNFIRSQNVFDFFIDKSNIVKVNKESISYIKNSQVEENDVLLNITGDGITFLRSCTSPKDILPAYTNQSIAVIKPDKSLDGKFLSYYFSLPDVKKYMEGYNAGSARRTLAAKHVNKFLVPLPSKKEQTKIATIISSLNDKIDLSNQMNKTLEQIAQTLFKHWFIDFEFPDENGNPYKSSGGRMVDSELGEIPEGWKVKQIGNICETFGGGTPKTSEPSYWEGGDVFWATPTDMTSLKSPVIFDTSRKITAKGLQNSSAKLLPAGSILMTSRATLGYFAISKVPISTNQGFISMVCDDRVSNYYLLNTVQNKMDEIENLAGGSTFLEINKTSFRSIKVIFSPKSIMKKFDEIADSIYENIFQNELETKKLAEIRDSLLPKLMSGKIRVEC